MAENINMFSIPAEVFYEIFIAVWILKLVFNISNGND